MSDLDFAVTSCGKNDDYGHPHSETMVKLAQADVKVYRTDLLGDINLESDGKSIKFTTHRNAGFELKTRMGHS
jgi:beta-lactamase superfamily II metal-dependent hydrolase